MSNIVFNWEDFVAPLDPLVILMALILGLSVGIVSVKIRPHLPPALLVWHIMGGVVFFIPLSILRAFQSSPTWERFLGTLVLWIVYILGMSIAPTVIKKVIK